MQLLKLYLKIKRVFRLLQQFLEIASSVNYENNEMNQQKKKKKEENWAKFNKVCCLEKRISPSADFFFFFAYFNSGTVFMSSRPTAEKEAAACGWCSDILHWLGLVHSHSHQTVMHLKQRKSFSLCSKWCFMMLVFTYKYVATENAQPSKTVFF